MLHSQTAPRRTIRWAAVVLLSATMSMVATMLPATAEPVPAQVTAADPVTPPPPPDNYVPQPGLLFNHPYAADRGQIHRHVLRMIRSTPSGSTIRMAAFAVGAKSIVDALVAARNRGVSVQVIGDAHLVDPKHKLYSRGFVRLRRTLGRDHAKPSWAMICSRSCRGTGGNTHTKMYLFDNVTGVRWVSVTGSANLTSMAVRGQWNHANTVIDKESYDRLLTVFYQMAEDTPADPLTLQWSTAPMGMQWVFPMPNITMANDPVADVLRKVQCWVPQPDGTQRRTKIRVNMYAWFDSRGIYLAKMVRSLWDQGCDVAILIGVGSKSTRGILRSRGGRGPIPAKRVAVHNSRGELVKYNHSKVLTVSGMYDGNPNANVIVTGSCNFTNQGNYSDEWTQIYQSAADVAAYNADFDRTWRERVPKAWRTVSAFQSRIDALSDDSPTLGEGKLWRAEAD